jgi:hypothetical protein
MSNIVEAAQAAGPQGKTAPAKSCDKTPMPKGDGLKTAWKDGSRSMPIALPMAKKKVR